MATATAKKTKVEKSTDKKNIRVKVIGCGGIGTHLLPCLSMYLNYSDYDVELTLIDGDEFEEKNRTRQHFSERGMKAMVVADDLRPKFEKIKIVDQPVYVTEDNVKTLISEGDVVMVCVDNHATRKLISDQSVTLKNVTVISGGNDWTDGNVMLHVRRDSQDVTLPMANKYHPEIVNPTDLNPAKIAKRSGCQQEMPSAPQLVIANNAIAAVMLNCFYATLTKMPDYSEVYVDVLTNNARATKRV